MTDWERALKFTSISEGGKNFRIDANGKPVLTAANKNDAGGPTAFGVTWGTLKAAYKDGLVSHDDITKLTKEEADKIYEVRYWKASHADEMKWALNLAVFDAGVNCGVSTSIKFLQRACNKMGSKLVADGRYGPLTANEVARHDTKELALQHIAQRVNYYHDIIERRPQNKIFLSGWLNRSKRLASEVEKA